MTQKSLQDTYAAKSICYGCGPANPQGFQIKSFVEGNKVIAHYHPKSFHHAFPHVLNGGVIGTLLDCHCNWAACWYLMQAQHLDHPPCTVTAEYHIYLLKPAPVDANYTIIAELKKIEGNKAVIDGALTLENKTFAKCEGTFVAVNENHPAYHRW